MAFLRSSSRDSNNPHILRSINRSTVLELIRASQPISRTQIARRSGISLPTVMRVVDDLILEKLVKFSGLSESTGGRPPTLLELDSHCNSVIGLDLGGTRMFGAVADIGGHIQTELYVAHREGGNQNYIRSLIDLIEQLLAAPHPPEQAVRGIGVGVSGVTLTDQGVVAFAPNLNWYDLPLRQILTDQFNLPVFIDNDVNMAALGEYAFGAGRGCLNMATITVGTGVGAGIIIDGALYRGRNQAAGEIGYMLPGIEFLGKQRTSRFGELENMISESGIAGRACRLLQEMQIPFSPGEVTSESVFEAARRGDAWAQRILDETIDYLSVAIGSMSSILDLDLIILGGGMAHSADLLIEPILKRLEGSLLYPPPLAASSLGYRATIMGAIMQVLNITTENVVLKYLA